jgi:hypothetical protein
MCVINIVNKQMPLVAVRHHSLNEAYNCSNNTALFLSHFISSAALSYLQILVAPGD